MPNTNVRVIKKRHLKPPLVALIIVLIIIIVIAILELTNTTYLLHKRKAVSGTIPSTTTKSVAITNSGQSAASSSKTSVTAGTDSTADSAKNQVGSQQASSSGLVTPYGTFVSNHHPSLSDSSTAPSAEQSVCQTSPGATCYIKFTNNSVVKTLATKTADQNGIIIWNWDVNTAGFTEGSWQITAVASLNSSTQTTTDPQTLEVGP